MRKIYTLLRNNKQSGPYTLDELITLGLKPDDLIWAEGKTAGWCYPNEIEDLKAFLSISKEPQQEKESATNTKELNDPPEEYTSVAKHIYVSLPSSVTKAIDTEKRVLNETPVSPAALEKSEESAEAKLERKAKELKERIQAFNEQKNLPKEDSELDVKYTRSLDDIKNEYSSWMHDQKKKKRFSYQPLVFFSVGIFILLLSFLGIHSLLNKGAGDINPQMVERREAIQGKSDYVATSNGDIKEETANKKKFEKKDRQDERIYSTKASANNQLDDTDKYIDSLRKAEIKKEVAISNTKDDEHRVESNKEVSVSSYPVKPAETNLPPSKANEHQANTKPSSENVSIDKLIRLSERSSGKERELTLHNSSSQALKFVAVDVYYYKANKSLLQKKTIYYQNIGPGSSVSLAIPENKKAVSVQYHLGLISSEKGLYYAKQ